MTPKISGRAYDKTMKKTLLVHLILVSWARNSLLFVGALFFFLAPRDEIGAGGGLGTILLIS